MEDLTVKNGKLKWVNGLQYKNKTTELLVYLFSMQVFLNIFLTCTVIFFVGFSDFEINWLYLFIFFVIWSLYDTAILSTFKKKSEIFTLFKFFNLSKFVVVIFGYFIFLNFYYSGLNGVIKVVHIDDYWDSGMYLYLAYNLYLGYAPWQTDFALYHGTVMSSGYKLVVYMYFYLYNVFGPVDKIIPLISLIVYSYLYLVFYYVLKKILVKKLSKIILVFLIFMMLMPGPLYWSATLSKEFLYFIFLGLSIAYVLNVSSLFRFKSFLFLIPVYFMAKFSRFSMMPVLYLSYFFYLNVDEVSSKLSIIKRLVALYFIIIITYFLILSVLNNYFGFDYLNSYIYQPATIDIKDYGFLYQFIPLEPSEIFYKAILKLVFSVFTESNPIYM
ncbi:MAG: hypothetical protein IE909_16535, partial [Campylobacterales bacterium]|nr:hypothetical protein [Campylobacterales bacterium]